LRTGGIGDLCDGHLRCGGECGRGFLGIRIGRGGIHLGVAQLAHDFLDLKIIGARGLGLDDLPFPFVAAELDVLFPGDDFELAELVKIEGEQALVAKVVGDLSRLVLL